MKKYFSFQSYSLIFILSFFFVVIDSTHLGFFADDISIFYNLEKNSHLDSLLSNFDTFDALRYLQIFNNYFFYKIIKTIGLNYIHVIQIILYFINSFILVLILKKFKIHNSIIIFSWLFSIFFGMNYEVMFWAHNLSMTLIASTCFLVFFYLNLLIKDNFYFKENIYKEFLIFLFAIYSILTYEQFIFGIFFVIIIRSILLHNYKSKLYSLSLSFFYFLISAILILLKILFMKKLSLDISFNLNNFVNNFLISILTPVKYLLTPIEIENIKGNNIYLFLFAYFLSLFISIKISNKYKIKKTLKTNSLLIYIIIFFTLYVSLFLPLYLHHISLRHFYLPVFISIVVLALILDKIYMYCEEHNKKKLNFIIFFIFSIFLFNNVFKINFYKYQQIENFC